MSHRQRVLAALRHREPDRVPIDLGSTCDSTILAVSYQALRRQLGFAPSTTRVVDVCQQGAIIDEDVRQALGVDVAPLLGAPREWRTGTLADGSPVQLPAKFRPIIQEDGSRVVVDAEGHVMLKMPKNGHYYDPIFAPLADATSVSDIDKHIAAIVSYDAPDYLDKSFDELAREAKELRETTDYAVVGFFGGHILQAGQALRGWETFLMDLISNKKLAHALMGKLLEAHLERYERYAETLGKQVDIVHIEEDLGMQDRPLMRPERFREMIKPYMKELLTFIKSKSNVFILLHTDGAVRPFIPDFIEMGIDAMNPVQVSAAGMDPQDLKSEFGRDITFWGAACNSQTVLPSGTPQEVSDEVRHRIDQLAHGGGYVFAPIHNIQPDVPVENVITMYRTARHYGLYQKKDCHSV